MSTVPASGGGRLSPTKYILRDTPERAVITRRHHPLQGQQFEVLQGGRERITLRLTDGASIRLPRHWTDADGVAPDASRWCESVLSVEAVRRLLELIEAFLRR